MDVIQLILRLLVFCATFFILLDFIIICSVKTWIGLLGIFAASILTIIVFLILRRYSSIVCDCCGRRQHTNLFAKKNNKGTQPSISYINTDPGNPFVKMADALH
jgi:hypothetical protein